MINENECYKHNEEEFSVWGVIISAVHSQLDVVTYSLVSSVVMAVLVPQTEFHD